MGKEPEAPAAQGPSPIMIVTTGGTIDKLYFDAKSEFQVGAPQIGQLLAEANVGVPFEVHPLLHKDSLDLTGADRELIAEKVRSLPAQRFLITHGTDTMLQTALLLEERVRDKVIVLVGAMQPALIRNSDAFFNIGFAFAAAQLLGPGSYVAMNGRVFRPRETRKNRELGRFEPLVPGASS
ncbi:MAG TPA: asparaginase domain-containing protein [Usitatibacter sp.]|nr:asparaginase domain-containing protein [Usitatibacter sp.]